MAAFDALGSDSFPRPTARDLVRVPFRPRTYGRLAYLALAFPLGIAYLVVVSVGLGLGVGLSVLLVGVPLLLAVLVGTMALAVGERALSTWLLGVPIDAPDWKVRTVSGVGDRSLALVTDPAVWAALVFVATKFVVGTAAFVLLVTIVVPALSLVATPLYYDDPGVTVGLMLPEPLTRELSVYVPWNEFVVGLSFVVRVTSWEVTTLPGALATSAVGLVALAAGLNVLNAAGWLCGRWARLLLGRPPHRAAAALRRRLG
jgi:hypothetical protein